MIYLIFLSFLFGLGNPDHSVIAKNVVIKFNKDIAKNKGLKMANYGGGMIRGIERYLIDYDCTTKLTVNQARELLVDFTESFLTYVNSSEAVSYLYKYPYDENDFNLHINFVNSPYKFVNDGNLAKVHLYNGWIWYAEYDSDTFNDIKKETYAEAYEIVTGKPFKDRKITPD